MAFSFAWNVSASENTSPTFTQKSYLPLNSLLLNFWAVVVPAPITRNHSSSGPYWDHNSHVCAMTSFQPRSHELICFLALVCHSFWASSAVGRPLYFRVICSMRVWISTDACGGGGISMYPYSCGRRSAIIVPGPRRPGARPTGWRTGGTVARLALSRRASYSVLIASWKPLLVSGVPRVSSNSRLRCSRLNTTNGYSPCR